jgi:uncharacterized protein (TIRG00374 family)
MALYPEDSRRATASKWLTPRRVWLAVTVAVVASVGVILWSVVEGASWRALTSVRVAWAWVLVALALVVLRDVGYVIRLMVLARGELGVKRATSSILLWELASALTPSVVGGSAVAAFILHRNGLSWGRSLATVMSTALLDELYFLVAVPAVALAVGWAAFLPDGASWVEGSVTTIFVGGYVFMAVLATFLSTALFGAPKRIRAGLESLASRRPFSRWGEPLRHVASDLHDASRDLRTMSWRAWCQTAAATAVSWTARFLTLNALLMAFLEPMMRDGDALSQFGVWARQLSMWTVMMISPTPGSSGLAELALPTFMSDVMPVAMTATVWAAVVLMWRYVTYHIYLLVGGALMPFWLAQTSSPN